MQKLQTAPAASAAEASHRCSTFGMTIALTIAVREQMREYFFPAPEGRPNLAQRFRVCVRTRFSGTRWNEMPRDSSPGGATELSPALQRWEKRRNESSPGGTTQFSRTLLRASVPTEQTFFITSKLCASSQTPNRPSSDNGDRPGSRVRVCPSQDAPRRPAPLAGAL